SAPTASSATAPSEDSRNDSVVFLGIFPPPAGRPSHFRRDPTDDTDRVDGAASLAGSAARVSAVASAAAIEQTVGVDMATPPSCAGLWSFNLVRVGARRSARS